MCHFIPEHLWEDFFTSSCTGIICRFQWRNPAVENQLWTEQICKQPSCITSWGKKLKRKNISSSWLVLVTCDSDGKIWGFQTKLELLKIIFWRLLPKKTKIIICAKALNKISYLFLLKYENWIVRVSLMNELKTAIKLWDIV